MEKIIAIQGFEGSFHQIAAETFFGRNIQIKPCATFREVVESTKAKESDASVMAIENSIAGSILANYNLLQKSSLKIVGEVYLPIKQHLLVSPGVHFEDIREVHSHPMAIQQCMDYLLQYNWKLVETEDTALSAKQLHQQKKKHTAAIAGKLAAELYDLEILAENIHTEKNNYTRFLILQTKAIEDNEANKASLSFQTDHTKGSLAKVLNKIAESGINLSKLQSLPIPGSNFKYKFHADLEFDKISQFEKGLEKIKSAAIDVKVFGTYKNGKK